MGEPQTEAGKALLDDDVFNDWRTGERYAINRLSLTDRILAIEAEARATAEGHIAALREALKQVWDYAAENWPSDTFDLSEQFDVLDSTHSAATEEVERIESRWRAFAETTLAWAERNVSNHTADFRGLAEEARALLDNEQ